MTTPPTFPMPLANINKRALNITEDTLWKQYEQELKSHPAFAQYMDAIWEMYHFTKTNIIHGKIGTPPAVRLNAIRLKNLLDALQIKRKPVRII